MTTGSKVTDLLAIARGAAEATSERVMDEVRAHLAAIVENSQDAIVSKTLDGIVTSWNKGAERLFGYPASLIVGQSILLIIPPERRGEETEILGRLRRGERIESYDTERMRRDGTRVAVSLTISPLRDSAGTIIGASKIARDVSARLAADRALRDSEQRFRSLVEASGAIVYNSDAQARWRAPNPGWEAYTGQSFEQYRDHGWATAIHADDRERVMAKMASSVEHGVVFETEARIWHAPSSTWRHQEARAVPMRDTEGTITSWVGTATDIHARREAEEALRAADRRKDEFLAIMAHELRNPLAPLANTLEVLRLDQVERPQQREMLDIMRRQVGTLVRLVDDLMEASRIARGMIELKLEALPLTAIVESAIEISRPLIAERGHQLNVSLGNVALMLRGDRTRLTQVLANLLNNAAKYTPPGGRLEVNASHETDWAVLCVRDNGVGIPPEMLNRIFDMFTQVDTSLERSHGGLGIGLSIVKRLVELHGGTIEVRSEGRGSGSEFILRLPLAQGSAEQERTSARGAAPPSRRVLVVDDNIDAAQSLALLLRTMGQEVHVAHSGLAALAEAASIKPAVMLLDIGMPGLNGYEVARRLRAEPWGRDIFVVAVTGWGQEDDRRRSREAGFDEHLVKPAALDALKKVLTHATSGGAGRPDLATNP
ncbi:MAG TPA: PAS domain S-box protein [Verrucomicrobiae bacterium]|nr:PAS domain S-box protein [Verrucomicrobiae bacterium]